MDGSSYNAASGGGHVTVLARVSESAELWAAGGGQEGDSYDTTYEVGAARLRHNMPCRLCAAAASPLSFSFKCFTYVLTTGNLSTPPLKGVLPCAGFVPPAHVGPLGAADGTAGTAFTRLSLPHCLRCPSARPFLAPPPHTHTHARAHARTHARTTH